MSRKVIISIIILLLLLAGLAVGLFLVRQRQEVRKEAAPATNLSIMPPTKSVEAGETFSLSVNIDTASNTVTAAELFIAYDGEKLSLDALTPGNFLPNVLVAPSINNNAGLATATLGAAPDNPRQGTGTLATLSFKALSAGSSTVRFDPRTQAAGIDEETNVVIAMNSSSVSIAGAATPTPTPTPTPTSAPTYDGGTGGTTPTPQPEAGQPLAETPTPAGGASPTPTAPTELPVAGHSLPTVFAALGGVLILLLGLALAF